MQCAWTDENGVRCQDSAIGGTPYCKKHPDESPFTVGFMGGVGGDPPIIITGGSVTVDFGLGQGQFWNDGQGKYYNPNKQIKRIEITGDGLNISEDLPTGKVTIKIYYGAS